MRVSDAMTRDVRVASPGQTIRDVAKLMYEDEGLEHVAQNMADIKVRRLPVVSREKRLVGIVSLGDLARNDGGKSAGKTVRAVSQPGGPHST